MREPMDVHALQEALLTPEGPWSALDVLETVDSTNLEALRDPRPWRVVLAEHQSAGRGRLTRQWEAPARASVAVSVVLPVGGSSDPGWLPLVTGMAMGRALADVAGVRPGLKWPNDLLLGDRKVCGVLCELTGNGTVVVAGAGANVDQGQHELPVPTATSLHLEGAQGIRREDVVIAFLGHLAALHGEWVLGGAALGRVRAAYRQECVTIGQEVDVHQPGGALLRGTATGVDDSGRLVLETGRGRVVHAAGDVVHVRRVTRAQPDRA
ncbi:biotin--[acetyl-CoA-carboxylase] ligase [Oryzihumus leptocrescens]|nr:biotin--[acetyl-CoA-carboxylase] ligase [Oryzihumus leptocrescens]